MATSKPSFPSFCRYPSSRRQLPGGSRDSIPILVFDDEEADGDRIEFLINSMPEAAEVRVVRAATPQEALEKLRQPISIATVDSYMTRELRYSGNDVAISASRRGVLTAIYTPRGVSWRNRS